MAKQDKGKSDSGKNRKPKTIEEKLKKYEYNTAGYDFITILEDI